MSTEKNLNNLVINKVENQDVYNYMKANSLINADELYLVEGDNEITITEATETESGLMSASDKVKLNGIEDGANKTVVDAALSSTSTNPVQNSIINAKFDEIEASIAGKVDAVAGKGLSTNDLTDDLKSKYDVAYTHSQQAHAPSDAEKNIIVGIQKNGTNLSVDSTTRKVNITVPTKTSDITNDSDYATNSSVDSKLSGKVDIISGKGLSTNDYTTNEKNKLSGIAVGADVSTIKSISKNGTALSIDSSKNVNIEVPTKVSQLSNDSGYLTKHQDISGKADKATTLSGYGITDAYTQTQVNDKLSVKADKSSTLAGYGITDAKISSGIITLGSNTITPVTSVNGKSGASVTLDKTNIGLGNVDNVKQYSASNPPPYPVTSVNGQTGAVTIESGGVAIVTQSTQPSGQKIGDFWYQVT